jgi:hypothetical protein
MLIGLVKWKFRGTITLTDMEKDMTWLDDASTSLLTVLE